MQLFSVVGRGYSWIYSAVYGSLCILLPGIASFIYTVPVCALLFVNDITNTVTFLYKMHVYPLTYGTWGGVVVKVLRY